MRFASLVSGSLALACFAHAAAPALAQSAVLVVDDSGGAGVDHTSLQAAVDAAAPGTVLLVRDGAYAGFLVDGKGLVITADVGHSVVVTGTTTLRNVPSGSVLSLDGLRLESGTSGDLLVVETCDGLVWIEDCVVEARTIAIPSLQRGIAVDVSDCRAFVVSRSAFHGGNFASSPFTFGWALSAQDSDVHVYDSYLEGAPGAPNNVGHPSTPGQSGAVGMYLGGGFLFASGSTILGGPGGEGVAFPPPFPFPCSNGGDGGFGMSLGGDDPTAFLHGTLLQGGPGGTAPAPCSAGQPGLEKIVFSGSVTTLPGTSRTFEVASPVRAGETATNSYGGAAGEAVWLLISGAPDASFLSALTGSLLMGPSFFAAFVGFVPASGTKTQMVPVNVGGAADSLVVYEQALFFDFLSGTPTLSSASTAVLLKSTF